MHQMVVGFADVDTARQVVREAAELAAQTGASMHIVTAIDEDATTVVDIGTDHWEIRTLDQAEEAVRNFMVTLSDKVDYTVGVFEGKPADVLIAEAERLDADLIVVGNVRMQGPGRLLGSVGSAVAHHAPCSVLIVKTT
ncbi:MAG: universal stress protein [Acidimicrobiales bacterium]|nr:universal stress protein [Acidimicrobiales bacterium]